MSNEAGGLALARRRVALEQPSGASFAFGAFPTQRMMSTGRGDPTARFTRPGGLSRNGGGLHAEHVKEVEA